MYDIIRESFPSLEAAIGWTAIHGCHVEVKEFNSTNSGLIAQGYTIKRYARTADGSRWAVHLNPTTGQHTAAHLISDQKNRR